MSRYAQKKVAYRPKEGQAQSRFGFSYNEDSINYRTQIPSLPEKPKNKPDEKIRDKKVQEIKEKIDKLKETRKKNKQLSKKLTAQIDQEYKVQKNKVELGRRCIVVLQFDIEKISDEIRRKNGKIKGLQNKVEDLIYELRELKAKNRPAKKVNKKVEQMTNRELDEQKNRIQLIMSTKSLTKKEESELNAQINRIARLKLQEGRPIIQEEHTDEGYLQKVEQIEKEIATLREKEKTIKNQRTKLFETRVELENKIEDIKEDITYFIAKLKEINQRAEQQEQTKKIREQSEKIKESIKKLQEEIQKVEHDFEQKVKEYEAEQQKIKWISWATKIQEKKRQQWEQEKAQRKKQKLKQKAAGQGKKQQGKNKDEKGGEKQKPFFQKKRINKNQKEIDVCSFLIDYCKRLIPSNQQSQNFVKKQSNPQTDISNVKWTKGLEVIKSKKTRDDEQENTKKNYKKKQAKQEEAPVSSNTFSHQFFVEQYFHSANLIPPTKPEELQKIIKDLEDKVEYYVNHPDQTVQQKFAKDKQFVENTAKSVTYQGKNTKSKGNSKSVINTEDFPAL